MDWDLSPGVNGDAVGEVLMVSRSKVGPIPSNQQPACHPFSIPVPKPGRTFWEVVLHSCSFIRENQHMELLVIISLSSCHSCLSLPCADTVTRAKD